MRRKYLLASLTSVVLITCSVIWTIARSGADQGKSQAVPAGKPTSPLPIAHRELIEECVWQEKSSVILGLEDDVLRRFIAHAAPTAKVKEPLQQVLDRRVKLKAAAREAIDLRFDLKAVTDDQARVRESLKVIPQSSEHYKDFLTKFVAQEKRIEEGQRQIRAQEAQAHKVQKEYETFVNGLTVQ